MLELLWAHCTHTFTHTHKHTSTHAHTQCMHIYIHIKWRNCLLSRIMTSSRETRRGESFSVTLNVPYVSETGPQHFQWKWKRGDRSRTCGGSRIQRIDDLGNMSVTGTNNWCVQVVPLPERNNNLTE